MARRLHSHPGCVFRMNRESTYPGSSGSGWRIASTWGRRNRCGFPSRQSRWRSGRGDGEARGDRAGGNRYDCSAIARPCLMGRIVSATTKYALCRSPTRIQSPSSVPYRSPLRLPLASVCDVSRRGLYVFTKYVCCRSERRGRTLRVPIDRASRTSCGRTDISSPPRQRRTLPADAPQFTSKLMTAVSGTLSPGGAVGTIGGRSSTCVRFPAGSSR